MRAKGLYEDSTDKGLNWYLELRKYGGVPLAGWGMGFERLVQYVTGACPLVVEQRTACVTMSACAPCSKMVIVPASCVLKGLMWCCCAF